MPTLAPGQTHSLPAGFPLETKPDATGDGAGPIQRNALSKPLPIDSTFTPEMQDLSRRLRAMRLLRQDGALKEAQDMGAEIATALEAMTVHQAPNLARNILSARLFMQQALCRLGRALTAPDLPSDAAHQLTLDAQDYAHRSVFHAECSGDFDTIIQTQIARAGVVAMAGDEAQSTRMYADVETFVQNNFTTFGAKPPKNSLLDIQSGMARNAVTRGQAQEAALNHGAARKEYALALQYGDVAASHWQATKAFEREAMLRATLLEAAHALGDPALERMQRERLATLMSSGALQHNAVLLHQIREAFDATQSAAEDVASDQKPQTLDHLPLSVAHHPG